MLTTLLVLGTAGCSSSESPEPEPEPEPEPKPEVIQKIRKIPVQKKVLYSQRSNEGRNAINVIEEQTGNRRALRIIVQRGDLSSNLVHPIDSPNFVISIPLQDATSKQFAEQTITFEQQLKRNVDELLSRYLASERFNVSLQAHWNQQVLEEIQLRSIPIDIPVTELKVTGKTHTQMQIEDQESYEDYPELESALNNIEFKVLLDKTLPNNQEKFIQQLIPAQDFFNAKRGDILSLERTSFPNPFSDSVAPYEEQIKTRKIRELIEQYVSPESYVLNIDFNMIESDSSEGGQAEIQMEISLLMDDTILPEIDEFLQEALPLAIKFNAAKGDTLNIVRKRFPETSAKIVSQEQLTALREYRVQILGAFKTGDYVSGIEWTEKGLKVAFKRSDKIYLLKMKGSLHFLLEEKQRALETWKHVQRLDPEDKEVAQMLSNLE